MATTSGFSTATLTFEDGYIVSDIVGVDTAAFRSFLADLKDRAAAPVQVYALRTVPGQVWFDLLSQLDDAPRPNGIKQIDLAEHRQIVATVIEPHDGFRDAWRIGSDASDTLRTGATDDVVFAQNGADRVVAGAGADFVAGGDGLDTIYGGLGADILNGGRGQDVLFGGFGNDILRGGIGGDRMTGGDGADTFLFSVGDFQVRAGIDVITDYDRQDGDQIVDTTGTLRVVDTGFVERVGAEGTLLRTAAGALVFVEDETLRQSDILTRYRPPSGDDNGGGGGGGGDDDGPLVVRGPAAEAYTLTVQRSAAFFDGQHNVETFDVFLRNEAGERITNLDDIRLSFDRAAGLHIVNASGATYHNGVFDVAGGGLAADGEARLFGFQVQDRPAGVPITEGTANLIWRPEGADGEPIATGTGLVLSVNIVDKYDGGASAEVFIRNIGGTPLVDLDGMEFSFDERVRVDTTWGAVHYADTFAVEPWGPDAPHGPLDPGARVKLFGFAFGSSDPDKVDAHDFALTSDFLDLLS